MTRKNTRQRTWTAAADATLRELYDTLPAREVAARLGRTKASIKNRINKLGIAKGHNPGCFAKGTAPWNKGVSFVAGGRSAETRFKPGRPPELARNYLPIGSLRINVDGYLERKISDDQRIAPAQRWRAVHILLWEAANGPLPKSHAVVFKDGDKRHIALDNLELVSRAELMRRNSVHRHGPEVAQLSRLRGVLVRAINRHTRGQPEKTGENP